MQSLIRRPPYSLPVSVCRGSQQSLLRQRQNASRSFADKAKAASSTEGQGPGKGQFVALALVLTIVPGYYFLHSGRSPAAGHAEQSKARREGDPSKEYRDPRDTGVKTLEQKRQKENQ